jgi:hypothetical protein
LQDAGPARDRHRLSQGSWTSPGTGRAVSSFSGVARLLLLSNCVRNSTRDQRTAMKDLLLVGVSVAFFALAWIYARTFDRL